MTVYFNGEFVDKSEVTISPDDRGFLFGDGVYEVVRAENGRFFNLDAHRRRLRKSLEGIQIQNIDTISLWADIQQLLPENDLDQGHAKLYLQITRGTAPRQHAFPNAETSPTVYATATRHEPPTDKWVQGVRAVLRPDQRWARCDIKSTSLLPNVLANQEAQEAGAYEALLVREGFITEGSHSSVMGVFDETIVTHPLTNRTLPGITRQAVLDLCPHLGIPVEKAPIAEAELPQADELFLTGTTTGVMPVVQVDDWTVADGMPGPVTRELQDAFQALEPG